jgi:hypothetical protein
MSLEGKGALAAGRDIRMPHVTNKNLETRAYSMGIATVYQFNFNSGFDFIRRVL